VVRKAHIKGKPPSTLTGQLPVSADHSPWWDLVKSKLGSYGILVGSTYTIEEITQMIPPYPDGRKPRPRTVARRLNELKALELIERGPNGSLGREARYKILPERPHTPAEVGEPMLDNTEFLEKAVERMTKEKRKR
jgi:hypothetical protein